MNRPMRCALLCLVVLLGGCAKPASTAQDSLSAEEGWQRLQEEELRRDEDTQWRQFQEDEKAIRDRQAGYTPEKILSTYGEIRLGVLPQHYSVREPTREEGGPVQWDTKNGITISKTYLCRTRELHISKMPLDAYLQKDVSIKGILEHRVQSIEDYTFKDVDVGSWKGMAFSARKYGDGEIAGIAWMTEANYYDLSLTFPLGENGPYADPQSQPKAGECNLTEEDLLKIAASVR